MTLIIVTTRKYKILSEDDDMFVVFCASPFSNICKNSVPCVHKSGSNFKISKNLNEVWFLSSVLIIAGESGHSVLYSNCFPRIKVFLLSVKFGDGG